MLNVTKPVAAPYFPAAAFTPNLAARPPAGVVVPGLDSMMTAATAPFPTVLSQSSLRTAPPPPVAPVPFHPVQPAPLAPGIALYPASEVTIPGAPGPGSAGHPAAVPAFAFGSSVTSPELVRASVPERWGFENPATKMGTDG